MAVGNEPVLPVPFYVGYHVSNNTHITYMSCLDRLAAVMVKARQGRMCRPAHNRDNTLVELLNSTVCFRLNTLDVNELV